MTKKLTTCALLLVASLAPAAAIPFAPEYVQNEKVEYMPFGNFDQWITRNIKESGIIGGQTKTLYEIAPTGTWNNSNPYTNQGGSPWATSNVLARVAGITKTNTSVYKETRPGHGFCAKLSTRIEKCVVLGIVNIKVLAAGTIFIGEMQEPITGTTNPMTKLDAGMKFNKKPRQVCFDYKVRLSGRPDRVRQTGFSKVKTVEGLDMPDCVFLLQKRWEDVEGNIYAKRVGTMVQRFTRNTADWVNNARFDIHYGDFSKSAAFKPYMAPKGDGVVRYAKNSKGKMVPINEVGWARADETPTHLIMQFDSSHGGAYVGSVGNTLWVDNVRLVY